MGFKMVIVPPNAQPDWPQKIRAAVPDCAVHMLPERRTEILIENCRRFNAGRPLHNVVDKANWF